MSSFYLFCSFRCPLDLNRSESVDARICTPDSSILVTEGAARVKVLLHVNELEGCNRHDDDYERLFTLS